MRSGYAAVLLASVAGAATGMKRKTHQTGATPKTNRPDEIEDMEIPESFDSKEEAIQWSIGIAAFESEQDALDTWNELTEQVNKEDIMKVWIESVMSLFDEVE